ncbi:MAG: Os1348 family NHLP clan protein [Burkholderiales bacterium]
MSAIGLEAFLAHLYTDSAFREAFLADPHAACSGAELTAAEIESIVAIDRDGLILAAQSIAKKRESYRRPRARRWWPWRQA